MANALEIAQAVADTVGVSSPNALVNSNDRVARRMLRLLNRGGKILTQKRNTWGAGWTVLTREHVFETVDGREEYVLPDDFQALIDGTIWDRTQYWEARGTLSPQQWQRLKSGLIDTVTLTPLYRLRRSTTGRTRSFWLDPVPSESETLVFEYTSSHWVSDAGGSTFRNEVEADTDTFLFDDDLVELDLLWRYLSARRLPFAAELAEFEMERDRRMSEDAGARPVTLSRRRRWRSSRYFGANVPDTGFGGV